MSSFNPDQSAGGRLGPLLSAVRLAVFDFDGVFTDNCVYVTQDGLESVRCWRSDGIGISRLRTCGVTTVILSTEVNPVVTARAKKMGIACVQGVEDKAQAIARIARDHGVALSEVAFTGNDVNDIPAFDCVGVPIAVADAYPEVFPHVLHRTVRSGGMGAVREVCDLVFHAKRGLLAR